MSFSCCPYISRHAILLGSSGSQNVALRTSKRWYSASSLHRASLHHKSNWVLLLGMASSSSSSSHNQQESHANKISTQKHEFDAIQDLMLSSPPTRLSDRNKSSTDKGNRSSTTALEKKALQIVGSPNFSLRDRADAMNGLLDLLEQKSVPTAYAFEFIRCAGKLIDELISEAKQNFTGIKTEQRDTIEDIGNDNIKESSVLFERKPGFGLEDPWKVLDYPSIASKVYICAERRGIARLVVYFQVLNMKASDIPKVIPYAGGGIDVAMAKVEFLRSIGVRSQHLPSVLASWPQILTYQCDSLVLVVEYLKSIGLLHKEIVAIIVKYPEVLGQSVELELRRTVDFLQEIGSSLKDVKTLITSHPSLLLQNLNLKLGLLVDYLVGAGIQKKHIGPLLVKRPILINSNLEKDLLPVINYLKNINASADDIDKIITSFPGLFCYDVEKDFRPAVSQFESVGVDPSLMGKLFRRHPQLLKNRMNIGSKVQFLLKLGLEKEDMGKVIYNAPQLLGLREEKLRATIKFLENIGVKGSSLCKVLKLKPMVLAYSVEAKLQPNISFLQNFGINRLDVGKLVTRHPQLLTLSIEKNLEPTARFLLELGFTREEVADMVRRLPSLLGLTVTNVLKPKYKFFIDVMQRSPKELVKFPQYFSYSLDRRIIPRYMRLGEKHNNYSLSTIYGCGDAAFEKMISRWNDDLIQD
ncbi:hypothetical protein SUGI_1185120 [Cryptomeria japonica]|uniref:transcription termination factor MTERF4, chloroplastic isoform X2 n=1 Tax=Cryptomeria japonica TaxID=3369 RepID=UPI0024149440|nr:transcription termination factor MTERF4, chloroplastic isoform X2 [Cryptomeria japonica]GLJ55235.1 hypothetical protein SUGI_1185120 [Cryptomeria japonica]